jgi:hypothetical protein
MDLILRETLKRSGVWESYKLKHNIVEGASADLWQYVEVVEKHLFDEMVSDSEVRWEYQQMNGIEQEDDTDDAHYQEWLKEYAEGKVYDAIGYLNGSLTTQDGEIVIYRRITAPSNWVEQGGLTTQPLGVFWSWSEHAAESHWGNFSGDHQEYLIVGSVRMQDVDWVQTLYTNANPSTEEEKEITVNDGAPVKFLDVYRMENSKPVEVSGHENLIGKRLTA